MLTDDDQIDHIWLQIQTTRQTLSSLERRATQLGRLKSATSLQAAIRECLRAMETLDHAVADRQETSC